MLKRLTSIRIGGFKALVILSFGIFLVFGRWSEQNIIRGDALGYCSYLASWVVYGDFDFEFYETLHYKLENRFWIDKHPDAPPFPKFTMGLAMLQLPAYLVAHIVAPVLGFEQDGWSIPYHLAIGLNGVLALVFGLWFTRKWLSRYFNKQTVITTLYLLVFGTNLLYYGALDTAQSHAYSFALLAAFLYLFDRWRVERIRWSLIIAGLCFGFIVLIRPTNALFALIPLVVLIHQKQLGQLLRIEVLGAVIVSMLPFIPQVIFWHVMSGKWIYYSYENEQLFWSNPHILDGLFSWRNGWLLYTPLMIVAILGLFVAPRPSRFWARGIGITLTALIYVTFCWWCWYYGGSFSIRPMIDFYAPLAFGLASAVAFALHNKQWAQSPALVVLALVVSYNLILTKHFKEGHISGSDMTKEAYFNASMNLDPIHHPEFVGLFQSPDLDRLRLGLPERTVHDTIVEKEWAWDTTYTTSANFRFGPRFDLSLQEFETTEDRILQVQYAVKSEDFDDEDVYVVVSIDNATSNYFYQTACLRRLDLNDEEWNTVSVYLEEPLWLPEDCILSTYIWYKDEGDPVEVRAMNVRQLNCPWAEPL